MKLSISTNRDFTFHLFLAKKHNNVFQHAAC